MSRTPEKGKPNFANLDDGRLRECKLMVNDLIGAFDFDPEVVDVLTRAWKALSEECVKRTCSKPDVVPEDCETPKVIKKRVVKSPLSRMKKLRT